MSTQHIIQTLFEIAVIAFIFWGYFNQDKLVRFEEKIAKVIKHKICDAKRAHFKFVK